VVIRFLALAVALAIMPSPKMSSEAIFGEIASELIFERVVAPFPVVAPDGREYALPFVGGLDVPRPQFVDIDGDGDLDLFVQEYSSQLWHFENVGSAKAPRYEWRTNHYQGINIGEWYRFVDIDQDGLLDLICEKPFSNIHFYKNVGSKTAAKFQYVDVLRDSSDEPVFMDRQNIPWLVDLDCDKHLDLFVGRVEGTLARFEAVSPGSTRFDFITENFEGISIVGRVGNELGGDYTRVIASELISGPTARPTTRHGANAISFADFDADGDQDLFWGDFFEPGVLLIENIGGTCSSPSFDVEPVMLPWASSIQTSGYNAPMPADIDGDGDLDFVMGVMGGAFNPVGTSADNLYFWERTGAEAFTLRTKRYLDMLDLGTETVPAFGDIDGDGDLDMLVGNKIDSVKGDSGRLTTFVNEGSATAPRFRQTTSIPMADAYHLAPTLGDLDADGDLDLLLGTWNQDVLYYRNEGTRTAPNWVQDPARTIAPPRASNVIPTLADIDGDNDLDLFLGTSNGVVVFYRNTGSRTNAKFELVTERLDDVKAVRRSAPALFDVDGDGLLDIVLGQEASPTLTFRNTGTKANPKFAPYDGFALDLPHISVPRFVDLNGDGKPDVVSGSVSGGLVFLRARQ
jgi:FG-GAP-like repeat